MTPLFIWNLKTGIFNVHSKNTLFKFFTPNQFSVESLAKEKIGKMSQSTIRKSKCVIPLTITNN